MFGASEKSYNEEEFSIRLTSDDEDAYKVIMNKINNRFILDSVATE